MLRPRFVLTKTVPLKIFRRDKPILVRGKWTEATPIEVDVQASVQPLKESELLLLPESSRSREWYKVYCADMLRREKEGPDGWAADRFEWQGDMYEVMKVENYALGHLDHWKALAARIEITPN